MKALIYKDTGHVEYQDHPEPEREDGDVLVTVNAVGICGSDMHAYLGHDPRRKPPLILGHEAAGTVIDGPLAGKKVVLNPLITCGRCAYCLEGRTNLCSRRDLIGMYRPGAFAERIAIPERNVMEIPHDMSVAHAALAEPAATALHAVHLADRALYRPLSDARALVIGAGAIGLFATLWLLDEGVVDVVLAETNPLRRETTTHMGICRVLDPLAEPPEESGFDLVVDAVGGKASRQLSMSSVRAGGVIMHLGLLDGDGGFDVRRLTLQEITVIGTYTYTATDFRTTVEGIHSGALGNLDWFEQRPLSEGAGAFSSLLNGQCAAPKIILRP